MSEEKEVILPEDYVLPADPKLSELFAFISVDEGVRVLPVTFKQSENDTQLFIAIQGKHDQASIIMANLMTAIDEMHDLSEQYAAEHADQDEDDDSSIIATS